MYGYKALSIIAVIILMMVATANTTHADCYAEYSKLSKYVTKYKVAMQALRNTAKTEREMASDWAMMIARNAKALKTDTRQGYIELCQRQAQEAVTSIIESRGPTKAAHDKVTRLVLKIKKQKEKVMQQCK